MIVLYYQKKGSEVSDRRDQSLWNGKENFDFKDEEDLTVYLGVNIQRDQNGRIEFSQPTYSNISFCNKFSRRIKC